MLGSASGRHAARMRSGRHAQLGGHQLHSGASDEVSLAEANVRCCSGATEKRELMAELQELEEAQQAA